jgi:integrase
MTVKVRPYKHGGWEADIVVQLDSGQTLRKRLKSPVASKSGSLAWGQGRERHLIQHGFESSSSPTPHPAKPNSEGSPTRREVPTLAEFAPRYLEGYARANRQKPSSIDSKQSHLSHHLIPRFGDKRLDELDNEQIQCLKAALADKSSKTVNNILTTLNTLLSVAVQWGVLEQMPAKIRLLKVTRKDAAFYDFDEYERLVEAAAKIGPEIHLQVLLGGDAGLRPGEVRALHWTSVDFRRQQLTIERNEYKGQFTLPKHDKIRRLPLTDALTDALKAYRHLRGPLVLYRDETCRLLTPRTQRYWLGKAQRLANLPDKGPHTLRHTFCSHLAMRGAPTKAIQELAGHADLSTTQRYMHLSPATLDASIRLLDRRSFNARQK